MLQFMKKWHQAFKEDKAVRDAIEAECELEAKDQENQSAKYRFIEALSEASEEHYEECCRRGYH
ncbi:hypothetical protein DZ860_16945 [Vibrio sinensis]|uniref:Uncharacterized protein n=1 Tax=Vibrio sinensis TaxID=2302434 RepID=A0A3A6QKR8_9VIBR|nr:hypothetical protein [Vibrio sinensis]RJX68681.1 hypothetical protein DZ860_16945 [Vibrio sinensis]